MTEKLLYKTSKFYLIFIAILIVIVIPISYFTIQNLYVNEVDETLTLRKDQFFKDFGNQFDNIDLSHFNKYNKDIKLLEYQNIKQDTLFFKEYFDTLNNETEPYRELNVPVLIKNKPYTLSVRTNMVESEDLIISIVAIFVVLLGLLMLGLFFINKRLSERLWKPFYQTLDTIEKFEIDKIHQPEMPQTPIEEFNRLNTSIEKLIQKNTSIYQSQREFIENAAHELQTPLAVFQAKIDTLMQNEALGKEQSKILISLNESVAQLNRLNKNLLLLSKVDNEIYSNKDHFTINEIIVKQLDFFTVQASSKGIKIITEIKTSVEVEANHTLTEILISNLFMNAIRHNHNNGLIMIILTEASITFLNTGSDEPLNVQKLFSRFSKTKPSKQGNGLGLAIVKKIADLNQWQIDYNFTENLHSFSVKF